VRYVVLAVVAALVVKQAHALYGSWSRKRIERAS
jgi:hypothetical protein